MELYAIIRRDLADPDDLETVDRRSQAELDRRPDEMRKIRSYVFEEESGKLGTICLYEAVGVEAIHDHSRKADVGLNAVRRVTTIDVHRPDPERLTT